PYIPRAVGRRGEQAHASRCRTIELDDSTRIVGRLFRLCERFSQQGTHKKMGSQATRATIQSNPERICRDRLVAREATRGEALDVCVLQRDLQTSHRNGRDREEASL